MLARWAQFCKDCYIISTCTPPCPATGTAWLWGLAQAGAWLCYPLRWLSIYNREWDITVIQPISSTSTSKLFRKALVDIWIDLHLIKISVSGNLVCFYAPPPPPPPPPKRSLYILDSPCSSVRLSVRPSVRPSVGRCPDDNTFQWI